MGNRLVAALVVGVIFYFVVYKSSWFQNILTRTGGGGTTTTTTKGGKPTTTTGGGTPTTTTGGGGSFTGSHIYPVTGKKCGCQSTSQTIHCGGTSSPSKRGNCNSCPVQNYEATAIIQFGGGCTSACGDEATIKHWGPQHHSSADCCWEIGTVTQGGAVGFNMEGPHPTTTKPKPEKTLMNVGSLQGKKVGLKSIIWKTATGGHHELYVDTTASGTSWKKVGARDFAQWGASKKTSTFAGANQQVEFRCDCSAATWLQLDVSEIKPPAGAAAAIQLHDYYQNYHDYKNYHMTNSPMQSVKVSNNRR